MTIIAPLIDAGSVRDYEWLLAAVADWLHKSNLTARIPDFVRLAEGQINRRLNIAAKEIEAALSAVAGSRYVALPSDFASPIRLQARHVEPRYDFSLMEAAQLPINDDARGLPSYWAIDGINIAFEMPADQAYSLVLRYVQSVYLSETNTTTTLLTRHPDLYLYGALAHSAPYIRDDARLPMWQSTFNRILAEVAAEAARSKGMATLRTEVPTSTDNHRRGCGILGY